MRCSEARILAATERELDAASRARLQAHLEGCARCRAFLATAKAQDALLCALPSLSASARLQTSIRSALAASPATSPAAGRHPAWRLAGAAFTLVLFLGLGVGTIRAAAGTIPGDPLYGVKLALEQARLAFTLDADARRTYEAWLRQRRIEEAAEALRLQRDVVVEVVGTLTSADEGVWLLDGLPVALDGAVGAESLAQGERAEGAVVRLRARVHDGRLVAESAELLVPAPSPGASAAASPEATAQRGEQWSVTASRTAGVPTEPTGTPVRAQTRLPEPTCTATEHDRAEATPAATAQGEGPQPGHGGEADRTPAHRPEATPTDTADGAGSGSGEDRAAQGTAAVPTGTPQQAGATPQPQSPTPEDRGAGQHGAGGPGAPGDDGAGAPEPTPSAGDASTGSLPAPSTAAPAGHTGSTTGEEPGGTHLQPGEDGGASGGPGLH